MSNEAFPFRTAREIDIGFARVLCIRITYLGELGYELYIPTEQAAHVYDRLVAAGRAVGLRHAGLKALASLRMEKGYRDYGHDIDNTDSVLEAGLGFAVDLDKPGGFIGRDAVLAQEGRGPADPAARAGPASRTRSRMLFHAELVLARRQAGRLRPRRVVRLHRSAARSAWRWSRPASRSTRRTSRAPTGRSRSPAGCYPATASLRPLYDPQMLRVKI